MLMICVGRAGRRGSSECEALQSCADVREGELTYGTEDEHGGKGAMILLVYIIASHRIVSHILSRNRMAWCEHVMLLSQWFHKR
jgi:hypothetical protein